MQRHYFASKGPSSQGYGFPSSHVWMWELDCEESWVPKNWCFRTVVLEKTLESPLDCKEIQPVHSKGDQSGVFFVRNDAKAETPVLWSPHAKSWVNPGVGDGQEGLVCCDSWGHKELDMTERLNWTETPRLNKKKKSLKLIQFEVIWRFSQHDVTNSNV